jgi:hypothetical protein
VLTCSTIFGVNIGLEFMTYETVQLMDEDAQWGIMIDLFALRIMYIHLV